VRTLRVSFVICICLLLTFSIPATDNSFKLDFDGDGRTDLALYREGSRDISVAPQPSYWFYLNTNNGRWGAIHWGRTLDVPAPADYDGDGKTDVGIYRWWLFDIGDTNEYWLGKNGGYEVLNYEWEPSYYKFSRNYVGDARAEIAHLYKINISQDPTVPCYLSVYFIGDNRDNTIRKTVGDTCNVNPTPVPGDYDNDGHSEIAVFNNHLFKVWFAPYSSGYTTPATTQFLDVDFPAVGDYDGDGKTDFAGTRAQNGRLVWRIKKSSDGSETVTDFGYSTDKPVPGDYDGDGKTDIAIWRPSDGGWWIMYSGNGSVSNWYFGLPTDTPLAAPVIPFDPS
jgi:hypothetical protein